MADREAQGRAQSLQQKAENIDVWAKTHRIKELKSKMQKELGIAVNDDKIKQIMKFRLGDFDSTTPINHDPSSAQSATGNPLFQRKRYQTTTASLLNSTVKIDPLTMREDENTKNNR